MIPLKLQAESSQRQRLLSAVHLSPRRIKLSLELSVCAGPRQGIFHSAGATASLLVKELSPVYYDMFVVVSSSLRQQAVCACMYVCLANGVSHLFF